MANTSFVFHVDPGHGWLCVDVADLNALDLIPLAFSRYSYRKGPKFRYIGARR